LAMWNAKQMKSELEFIRQRVATFCQFVRHI